jgi:hypothetical protein
MSNRRERRILRDALVELAGLAAPPTGAPATAAALDADLGAELVGAALAHNLTAPLRDALIDAGWDGDMDGIDREIADDRLRRLRGISTALHFGKALDEAGHPWVALKGPVVASFLPRPEIRSFNDLDLLVSGRDLGAVIDTLVAAGAEEVNKNWQGYLDLGSGEVPVRAPMINIDLHWHLIGMANMRRFFSMDINQMLERRRRVALGDGQVGALDPADQLIHVALHSAFAGAARLDQLRDVAALSGHDAIDWDVLVRRAEDYRAARMVGHTLDRSAEVLGAAVPEEVRVRLVGWGRHPRRRIDRAVPRRLTGRKGYVRWIPQGHRDDMLTTARVAAKLIQLNLATRLGRPPRFDAGDVGGPLYYATDAGGNEVRAAYLEYAESESA